MYDDVHDDKRDVLKIQCWPNLAMDCPSMLCISTMVFSYYSMPCGRHAMPTVYVMLQLPDGDNSTAHVC